MSTRLYVGNIPYSMTTDELRALFVAHGTVTDVHIVLDRETGRPRGFAFVALSTADEASAAASALNGERVGGRPLVVNVARERGEGPPSRGAPRKDADRPPRPAGPGPGAPRRPPAAMPPAGPAMMPDEEAVKEDRRRARSSAKKKGRGEVSHLERASLKTRLEEEEAPGGGGGGGWRRWLDEEEDDDADLESPWRKDDFIAGETDDVGSDVDDAGEEDADEHEERDEDAETVSDTDSDSGGLGALADKLRSTLDKKKDE